MTEQAPKKGRKLWQMLLLAVILIGFPLGSWIYLTKGFNYQMEVRDQLRRTDQLTSSEPLQLIKGKLPENLEGSMYLITLLPNSNRVNLDSFAVTFKQLHEQFDNPKNIQFWNVFEKADTFFVNHYMKKNGIVEEDDQVLYFSAGTNGFGSFVEQFGFTNEEKTQLGLYPQVIMVDDDLYVRRVFRIDLIDDVKQLVEATALLLPERSKPKARVVRESEK